MMTILCKLMLNWFNIQAYAYYILYVVKTINNVHVFIMFGLFNVSRFLFLLIFFLRDRDSLTGFIPDFSVSKEKYPRFEFRILCLEGSVISPSAVGSPDPI